MSVCMRFFTLTFHVQLKSSRSLRPLWYDFVLKGDMLGVAGFLFFKTNSTANSWTNFSPLCLASKCGLTDLSPLEFFLIVLNFILCIVTIIY